jgi:hypothetical protein
LKKHIWTIIFWGSLWGLTEATLGNALHIIPFKIGWPFWFPIAYLFMNKVYIQTENRITVLYTALIAASIKLIDLFMPIRIDYTLNPAVSIIIESLSMLAVWKLTDKYNLKFDSALIFEINTCWRILYAAYVLFLPAYFIRSRLFQAHMLLLCFL